MASGIAVDPCCVATYNEIKANHKYRYIIFCVKDDLKSICVHKVAPCTATFEEFTGDLMKATELGECRYAVYDFEYDLPNGQHRSKLAFMIWNPEHSKVKQKMVYASSKAALKKALQITVKEMQIGDEGDLIQEELIKTLSQYDVGKN